MHHARIATFILGALLLGSLFQAYVATRNFRTVDAILESPPPEASKMIDKLGHDSARQLLRYLAGEENRGYFETWEIAELALGIGLAAILFFGLEKRLLAGLAGALLVLTLFQYLKLTPDLVWLGRSISFLPATTESHARTQFGKLHGIYGGIEIVKILLLLTITGFLFRMRRRVRERVKIDPVNHPDHRHVNR
jgi:hypothetical protein